MPTLTLPATIKTTSLTITVNLIHDDLYVTEQEATRILDLWRSETGAIWIAWADIDYANGGLRTIIDDAPRNVEAYKVDDDYCYRLDALDFLTRNAIVYPHVLPAPERQADILAAMIALDMGDRERLFNTVCRVIAHLDDMP